MLPTKYKHITEPRVLDSSRILKHSSINKIRKIMKIFMYMSQIFSEFWEFFCVHRVKTGKVSPVNQIFHCNQGVSCNGKNFILDADFVSWSQIFL
jgi:hypothetical protein